MHRELEDQIRSILNVAPGDIEAMASARAEDTRVAPLLGNLPSLLRSISERYAAADAERQAGELAHRELTVRDERFELAMLGSQEGVWDWDPVNDRCYFSPAWKAMIGYADVEISDSRDEWARRVHPDDLDGVWATLQTYLRGETEKYEAEFRFRHRDDHYIWVLARGVAIRDASGTALRVVGTHVDITDRRHLEAELFEEKELAQVTLAAIGDGVLVTDAEGRVTFLNPVAERLLGWRCGEARQRDVNEVMQLLDELSGEPRENPVDRCRRESAVVGLPAHTVLLARDRRRIPVEDSVAPILDREGTLVGVVMVFHDITTARDLRRQMSWHVEHDSLTGLCNRMEFERRLAVAVDHARLADSQHALLYLDLDQFKIVNDTHGHMAGDELLKQLAGLIQGQVRRNDLLARLGGDEFGVLLENCALDKALTIADKLRGAVRDFRFAWQDQVFEIGVSVGLVGVDRETLSASEAMSAADVACYTAKDQGRNRVYVYGREDRRQGGRHGEMHMANDLKAAIKADRLVLYAQEIRPLKASSGGSHYEVLVRMRGTDGSLVPPGLFIPAAERYGLMPEVDRWVIRNVLQLVGASPNGGGIDLAINLSGLSLLDEELPGFISEALRASGVQARRVCFEITETAAIAQLGRGVQLMRDLKALGCRFALDDFGSGMSSFGYLKTLPVDYLKIDGAFVRDMTTDLIDRTFVETINRIGQVMGKETIAEFVETEAILRELSYIGVDYAQGYGVAKPQPIEEILARTSG